MGLEFISNERFPALELALLEPPSWTRLEPQSASGDPGPGIEARVHDPSWLLARQWQLGEFQGEDAGTPLTVRVVTTTVPIDRWATGAGAGAAGTVQALGTDLLEAVVEREPVLANSLGPGLRPRAEAGAAFLAALDDVSLTPASAAAHRAAVLASCSLVVKPASHPGGSHAGLDPAWDRLKRLLAGRAADGELLALAGEQAGGLPAWLVPADAAERDALEEAFASWSAWYRDEVWPLPGADDAWVGERLEHRFRVAAGDAQGVLEAPAHGGGEIDWHSFDLVPGASLPSPDGVAGPAPEREVHAVLATPLRYPGMPADRLWEMEDAEVNLGVVEAEPWDLARMLVAEFALTFGTDWLVTPIDVPFGSVTRIESLVYTTTFGEHYVVRPSTDIRADDDWRMFTVTAADGRAELNGLVVAPGAVAVQDGPEVEEVLFLRDEMANMVWAVERSVQGPSGAARQRSAESDEIARPGPGPVASAQLDYLLQTSVPARWIPYLPRSLGCRSIELVQGAMPDPAHPAGDGVPPQGHLLLHGGVKRLKDAEVPREGVRVRRLPSVTRRSDGTYLRWTTRRVEVGRGEGASRLGFDETKLRR